MTAPPAQSGIFEGGPPALLEARLGLLHPAHPNIGRRMLLVVLVGWAPLLVLTALQRVGSGQHYLAIFLGDFGVHARYLVAAPLLILAEMTCAPRLGDIARHFLANLVQEQDRQRLIAETTRTRDLVDSAAAEILAIVLAYASAIGLAFSAAATVMPPWHVDAEGTGLSPAGWWHALVSLPILLVLLLGWVWRLALWIRLLWRISRLDLKLIPVHPDRAAGLLFVGYSARAFSIVALALGTINAGRTANSVLEFGRFTYADQIQATAMTVLVLILFVGPLLVFSDRLLGVWRHGVFQYGSLASRVGEQFEQKWFSARRPVDTDALSAQDFSATTDLYQIVANVNGIRVVPIDLMSVLILASSVLLPLLPIVPLVLPMQDIMIGVKQLLF